MCIFRMKSIRKKLKGCQEKIILVKSIFYLICWQWLQESGTDSFLKETGTFEYFKNTGIAIILIYEYVCLKLCRNSQSEA